MTQFTFQNWSAPNLNTNTVASTDLFTFLTPIPGPLGAPRAYQPRNIYMGDFAPVIASLGLLAILPNLPTTAPQGGGLWLDDGHLAYSAVTGTVSGAPLTVDALAASLRSLMAVLPNMGATATLAGFQNNDGIIQDTTEKSAT